MTPGKAIQLMVSFTREPLPMAQKQVVYQLPRGFLPPPFLQEGFPM